MAKLKKVQHDGVTPCPFASCSHKVLEDVHPDKKQSKSSEKREWQHLTCSVCMEFPHNAVLLLCSSYNKGCRPYMCATSHRYSNCLEQYKKAYTKVTPIESGQQLNGSAGNSNFGTGGGKPNEKMEVLELLCPLCRGQVKGWTVVEQARKYLNTKKRTCTQENCSFTGSYKELRKHVRVKHPLARPRAVDPKLEEKWKRLESERERSDVVSTIISSIPGAIVLGDYVIEPSHRGFHRHRYHDEDDYLEDNSFPLGSFNLGQNGGVDSNTRFQLDNDSFDEDDFGMRRVAAGSAISSGRGYRRILFGRSWRRRRHRQGNGGR